MRSMKKYRVVQKILKESLKELKYIERIKVTTSEKEGEKNPLNNDII